THGIAPRPNLHLRRVSLRRVASTSLGSSIRAGQYGADFECFRAPLGAQPRVRTMMIEPLSTAQRSEPVVADPNADHELPKIRVGSSVASVDKQRTTEMRDDDGDPLAEDPCAGPL